MITITFILLLFACRDKKPVNCDQIHLSRFSFSNRNLRSIPSKCTITLSSDSLTKNQAEFIGYDPNEKRINLLFGDSVEDEFMSDLNYSLIVDDTLLFRITDIKIKTDTGGMNGVGRWVVFCVIDSFNVNNIRLKSEYSNGISIPIELGEILSKESK